MDTPEFPVRGSDDVEDEPKEPKAYSGASYQHRMLRCKLDRNAMVGTKKYRGGEQLAEDAEISDEERENFEPFVEVQQPVVTGEPTPDIEEIMARAQARRAKLEPVKLELGEHVRKIGGGEHIVTEEEG